MNRKVGGGWGGVGVKTCLRRTEYEPEGQVCAYCLIYEGKVKLFMSKRLELFNFYACLLRGFIFF